MKKSLDNPIKLGFFNQTVIENLQNSIQNVIDCLDEEKVNCECAEEALHVAGADLHKLFWSTTIEISKAKTFVRTWQFCHEAIAKLPKQVNYLRDTPIDYRYTETDESTDDDMASYKMQQRNMMFGFSELNPSDRQEQEEYNAHKTH